MKLRFLRYAFPAPGKNYQKIGKTGLIDFFNSRPEKSSRHIPPGARAVLDPKLDATTVTTDELAHGFYEFEINQPARVTVFQRDPNHSSVEVIDTLPKLPRENPGTQRRRRGPRPFSSERFPSHRRKWIRAGHDQRRRCGCRWRMASATLTFSVMTASRSLIPCGTAAITA